MDQSGLTRKMKIDCERFLPQDKNSRCPTCTLLTWNLEAPLDFDFSKQLAHELFSLPLSPLGNHANPFQWYSLIERKQTDGVYAVAKKARVLVITNHNSCQVGEQICGSGRGDQIAVTRWERNFFNDLRYHTFTNYFLNPNKDQITV